MIKGVDFEQSRRDLITTAAKGAIVLAGAAVLRPESAQAAEPAKPWEIKWTPWEINWPKGNAGEQVPATLLTAANRIIAVTTGDIVWTDSIGEPVEFTGRANGGNRTTLMFVEGPVGIANGGKEVNPLVRALQSWYGVTDKPVGGMTPIEWQQLEDERVMAIRTFNKPDRIDVVRVRGLDARILYTKTIYPV